MGLSCQPCLEAMCSRRSRKVIPHTPSIAETLSFSQGILARVGKGERIVNDITSPRSATPDLPLPSAGRVYRLRRCSLDDGGNAAYQLGPVRLHRWAVTVRSGEHPRNGQRNVCVKSHHPLDSLAPGPGLHRFGAAGSAVGGGEGAVFFGRVMAGGVDADDFAVD